jgi:acyl-CoA dehydrogenase
MPLDEQTYLRMTETVRRFVRDRLVPREPEVAEADAVPEDIVEEMRALGLFGLSIPQAYGGLGLTMYEEAKIVEELGYTLPVFRSVVGTNIGIGSQGIVMDGTEEQKRSYLPRLASGELVASFALTEPGAGSDAASITTYARREGDDYVLTGTKRYITNAPRAGIFVVMARTGASNSGAAGITAFIVDATTPGITLGKPERKMGQRAAQTCDISFDGARVPAHCIVGGQPMEGQGFRTAMKVLDRGRLHLSALAVGTAGRLIDESLTYSVERHQFGQPIAAFQLIQAMLADSKVEHYAGLCMVADAARSFDRGGVNPLKASCCKLFCTEMVGRIADRAVQIFGGAGYMADYPVERFYRDVRLFRLYEGTSQIQQLIIARNMIREAKRG